MLNNIYLVSFISTYLYMKKSMALLSFLTEISNKVF